MNIYKFLLYLICLLSSSFWSCSDHKVYNVKRINEKQKKIIDSVLAYNSQDLKLEFYGSDSVIIKSAYRYSGNSVLGKRINFFSNGNVESIAFYNSKGEKIGDEYFYFPNQNLNLYYFWGSKDNLFFKMEFDWDGNIRNTEGSPYYIERPISVKQNEEISIYIATPIIPGYSTEVTIGEVSDSTTHVTYVNDIRQFRYKISYKELGIKPFFLKVNILEQDGLSVVSDSVQFDIKVQ